MGEAEEGPSAAYDIFINHRGPDTKKNIASLVCRRLTKCGLRVFLDQDELEDGDCFPDIIRSAISSSSVYVVIFSVRYAESPWCLNELLDILDMLKSGRKVITIFYGVKPADLRYIKGPYADSIRKHQNNGRHNVELVERWKAALQEASNICGREFDPEDDLGDLLDATVEKVLNVVKWELLHVAEFPVGLHEEAEAFRKYIKERLSSGTPKERHFSGTPVVGIMGVHGSGKTTLVKHLYNCYLQSRKFKSLCFLSMISEKDSAVLQQKLVRDLLSEDKIIISDTTEGKGKIRRFLKRCGPALIVLDGLNKEEQVESLLLGVKDVLAEGSLILVTCHDRALLAGNLNNVFYDVKLLQRNDAHDLFCWYAFRAAKPPEDLEDLVEEFLGICCGYPLALKVLGTRLSTKRNKKFWKEQLEDLNRQKSQTYIVDDKLEASYNYLEEREKEIFLFVAHFLVGKDRDLAVTVLERLYGCGVICLNELRNKCLLLDIEEIEHCELPVPKGTTIFMDDLVRKMARRIVSSSKIKRLRLLLLFCKSYNIGAAMSGDSVSNK